MNITVEWEDVEMELARQGLVFDAVVAKAADALVYWAAMPPADRRRAYRFPSLKID